MRLVWLAIELISGAIILALLVYSIIIFDWHSILYVVLSAALGWMVMELFGPIIPGVSYLLRKWDKHDDNRR